MLIANVIALIIILLGALNWGAVGFANYNVIAMIFGGPVAGDYSVLVRVIFAIVGLAGVWGLSFLGRIGALCCSKCDTKKK